MRIDLIVIGLTKDEAAGFWCESAASVHVPNETPSPSADFVKVGSDVPNRNEATRESGFQEMVVVGRDVKAKGPVREAAVAGAGHSDRGNTGRDPLLDVGPIGEFREGIERERKAMLSCDLTSTVSVVLFAVKFVSYGTEKTTPGGNAGSNRNPLPRMEIALPELSSSMSEREITVPTSRVEEEAARDGRAAAG